MMETAANVLTSIVVGVLIIGRTDMDVFGRGRNGGEGMTRERLEGMRDRMIPWITHKVKGISLPNYSESDREKVREDLEELFDLATKALEQEPRKDEVILTNKEYRELIANEYDNGYCKGYLVALEEQESMLDKIRAEIEELDYITFDGITKRRCLEIIDKYKAETEVQDGN